MKEDSFYEILCHSTPEEINSFISNKGKKKMVNAMTYIKEEKENDSIEHRSSSIHSGGTSRDERKEA